MKPSNHSSQNRSSNSKILTHWAAKLVAGSVLFVFIVTLLPFNFTPIAPNLHTIVRRFFAHHSDLNDLIGNVIFFLPFGFGLACLARQKGFNHLGTVLITFFASSTLSLTVETLQLFLPSRSSSVIDICTNTTGGVLGAIAYLIWCVMAPGQSPRFADFLRRRLSGRVLIAAIVGWLTVTTFIVLTFQQAATFSNWDTSFPLLLGNEQTQDRPWTGTISKVEISDRASSASEVAEIFEHQGFVSRDLIAAYTLTGPGGYPDRTGHLPDLVWRGGASQPIQGGQFTTDRWLSTQKPATALAKALKETSEFTLSTIVATSDFTQTGPARIISLSGDASRRNFTLGQEKTDLVFRLRTRITGINGSSTALLVPDVFSDTKIHHLVLTYKHQVLTLYVDNIQRLSTLKLTPDITLFRYLFSVKDRSGRLVRVNPFIYATIFYVTFFTPLGLLIALIVMRLKSSLSAYLFVFVSGVFIPALLLELLIRGDEFRLANLAVSVAIATFTMLLVKARLSTRLKSSYAA
ncbi:VanZ family protein [Phormidesmis priestleyi ULC007]|uniref:VanZ family protein n=1 Tax=Phormidesmis priestleyi ULC007 TaxID=1920490 RepID=A0A2T1DK48_9CYAN|nr:VanZ family protein [Phormidesmis priestleyi]PSB20852.1 VanZ family protein [Phormidesmis priestleyi ULC007]PZO51807.1 MAG: VanZ family protein [Phormidesmis priestleyi]